MEKLKNYLEMVGEKDSYSWLAYNPQGRKAPCTWSVDDTTKNLILLMGKIYKSKNQSSLVNELLIRGLKSYIEDRTL